MSERALSSTFTWDASRHSWLLATRRDGTPLVRAWPGLHLRLEQGRLATGRDDDACSAGDELPCDRIADAARPPGDDGRFAVERELVHGGRG